LPTQERFERASSRAKSSELKRSSTARLNPANALPLRYGGLKRMGVSEIVNFDLEPEHIHLFDKNGEIIVA
jgi:hypothetical protein